MFYKKSRLMMLAGAFALLTLFGCSSGGDETPVVPNPPDTPAEFTTEGWNYFKVDNYDEAVTSFNSALALDNSYAEAMAGKGWCQLMQAASVLDANSSIVLFNQAQAAGENENYVKAGLAAAQLASAGDFLDDAITNAGLVLSDNPAFVFEYQITFDSRDLILIRSFAHVVVGDFELALAQSDLIQDSGIVVNDPETWVVDAIAYTSFEAAVLANLHELSEYYSG